MGGREGGGCRETVGGREGEKRKEGGREGVQKVWREGESMESVEEGRVHVEGVQIRQLVFTNMAEFCQLLLQTPPALPE